MTRLSNDELVTLLRAVTVEVQGVRGNGSGVAWPDGGHVLTCSHVMQDERAEVRAADGSESPARVLRRADDDDLAILGLATPLAAPGIEVRREPLRVGELLFAMGHPWGEPRSLTSGVVILDPEDGPVTVDLRVGPGNSGGPLVDSHGRLTGIISMYRGGAAVAMPIAAAEALISGIARADAA